MKFLPLVWAGLWRKRVRTVLAMISVAIAFWLYGTLDAVTAAFDDALSHDDGPPARASRQNRAGLPLRIARASRRSPASATSAS
jgi:hypothetical protein